MTPEEQIKNLREQIAYHSDRYYNRIIRRYPITSLTMLMLELKKRLEQGTSRAGHTGFTDPEGGRHSEADGGVLVRHNVPMLSLQDVFSKEEIYDFCGTDERS